MLVLPVSTKLGVQPLQAHRGGGGPVPRFSSGFKGPGGRRGMVLAGSIALVLVLAATTAAPPHACAHEGHNVPAHLAPCRIAVRGLWRTWQVLLDDRARSSPRLWHGFSELHGHAALRLRGGKLRDEARTGGKLSNVIGPRGIFMRDRGMVTSESHTRDIANTRHQKRFRRKERAARIADANRMRKLSKQHNVNEARDREARAPGAGEVIYAAQGDTLREHQAQQDDPYAWLEKQLNMAEHTGAEVPTIQDSLRRHAQHSTESAEEDSEASQPSTSDSPLPPAELSGGGGEGDMEVGGGWGRYQGKLADLDSSEDEQGGDGDGSGRRGQKRGQMEEAVLLKERGRQREEELMWDAREAKARNLRGHEKRSKESLLKKLAEAERLCDEGLYSRDELKSLARHVESRVKEIDHVLECRVGRVQEERRQAAVRQQLRAAGLEEQTDLDKAGELLEAQRRARKTDWEGLKSLLGDEDQAVSAPKARGKEEKKRARKEAKREEAKREGEERENKTRVVAKSSKHPIPKDTRARKRKRTRREEDASTCCDSDEVQMVEQTQLAEEPEMQGGETRVGHAGKKGGRKKQGEGDDEGGLNSREKKRGEEAERSAKGRGAGGARKRGVHSASDMAGEDSLEGDDWGRGGLRESSAGSEACGDAGGVGKAVTAQRQKKRASGDGQRREARREEGQVCEEEDGRVEEEEGELEGLEDEAMQALPALEVLYEVYQAAQRRASGQLHREQEVTGEDLMQEIKREREAARDAMRLKPAELVALEQRKQEASVRGLPAQDEAAWLHREGGLDFNVALSSLRKAIRSDRAFARAAETLLLYATNVLEHPGTEAFRIVRVSNKLFSARLGSFPGGLRCMFALGFRPVTYVGAGGPSIDPLHDNYLALFRVPKDLARNKVVVQQAFNKVAASKGYSVISLRENEALSVSRGGAREKLSYLQSLVALEAHRARPGSVSSKYGAKRSSNGGKPGSEGSPAAGVLSVAEQAEATQAGTGAHGGSNEKAIAGFVANSVNSSMHRAIFTARPSEKHMAPAFSNDLDRNGSACARGAPDASRHELLAEYLKEVLPAWEGQLCDPEANALLPHIDNVGIGVQISITRPDSLHHDRRQAEIVRVLRRGPADLCGLAAGDRIVSIDGLQVEPLIKSGAISNATAKVTALIRGVAGSNVTLVVQRCRASVKIAVGGGVVGTGGDEKRVVSVMRGQKFHGSRAAPVVLVACISADRCQQVAQALSEFDVRCPVARLYGPPKPRDFVNMLKGKLLQSRIFVGTPGKLMRLAQAEAYDVHNLQLLVADMFVDAKARHLCSMPETRLDLLLLYLGVLWPQASDGDVKIAFF